MTDRTHLDTDVTHYYNPDPAVMVHVLKIDFAYRPDAPKHTVWLAVDPHPDKRKKKPRVANVYKCHAKRLIRIYKLKPANIGGSCL